MLVRLCALRHFGYFLADMDDLDFTYNEEQAEFFGPTQQNNQAEGDEKQAQDRMVSGLIIGPLMQCTCVLQLLT
jgi:hypothetical protein